MARRERQREDKKRVPGGKIAFLKNIFAWLITFWPVWTISLFILFILWGVYSYVAYSPEFDIKKVEIKDSGQGLNKLQKEVEWIIGRNIFYLDLKYVSDKLQKGHPEISEARVIRRFPNEIVIELKLKRPLAQVRAGRHYLIGDGGVVLPPGGSDLPYQNLPYILGTNVKPARLRVGERLQNTERIFKFIQVTQGKRLPPGCVITALDLSNPKEVTFFTSQAIEVRVGEDGFEDKLSRFVLLWPELIKEKPAPQRIDLRYPDIRVKK
ncbi:MAG: FtsQ-type POTRA domain-containing protein [Candidatus Omnitrophica bacterium]|nr:FtsQ-type POTRA domain-containing protein [Candidatus Omnitrophota bacterium]